MNILHKNVNYFIQNIFNAATETRLANKSAEGRHTSGSRMCLWLILSALCLWCRMVWWLHERKEPLTSILAWKRGAAAAATAANPDCKYGLCEQTWADEWADMSRRVSRSEQTWAVCGGWLGETYWVRRGTLFPVGRTCWQPWTLQAALAGGVVVAEGPGRLWVQAGPTFEVRCSDWTL